MRDNRDFPRMLLPELKLFLSSFLQILRKIR